MASYVVLWVAVIILGFSVVALLRQVGVLHTRLRPLGVNPAGEGPVIGDVAPELAGRQWTVAALTLIAFTSSRCPICRTLVPSLHVLERQYGGDVSLLVLEHGSATAATFAAFNVTSTPYLVAVDAAGVVQGAGVANSLEQVEVLLEESRAVA
jgi:thiol-disulfide isomerase/thioredoxin